MSEACDAVEGGGARSDERREKEHKGTGSGGKRRRYGRQWYGAALSADGEEGRQSGLTRAVQDGGAQWGREEDGQ